MRNYPPLLLDKISNWQKFRQSLYSLFTKRKDTIIDLIDSLSSNQNASDAVELSEEDLFRRDYNSLYKGIVNSFDDKKEKQQRKQLHQLIFSTIELPENRSFHLLGLDVTSKPRPHAQHLLDRGCQRQYD